MNVLKLADARMFSAHVLDYLTVKIFRPKRPALKNEDYLESYFLWKKNWGRALKEEMGQMANLHSDHFTRQQMIVTLFNGDTCLGLFTSNQFDLRLTCDRDDTYFIDWPDEVLEEIQNVSPYVMTLENFTLRPNKPRELANICLKQLFGAIAFSLLERSRFAGIMLSTPRRNKNIHHYTKLTGAYVLKEDVAYKIAGERVDLVAWKKGDNSGFTTGKYLKLAQILLESRDINQQLQGESYVA